MIRSALAVRLVALGEGRDQPVDTLAVDLPRELELAKESAEVSCQTLPAARDLILASLNKAIQTVNAHLAPPEHLRHVLALALRGIGVSPANALKLSQMPLPKVQLPPGLLQVRE